MAHILFAKTCPHRPPRPPTQAPLACPLPASPPQSPDPQPPHIPPRSLAQVHPPPPPPIILEADRLSFPKNQTSNLHPTSPLTN